MKRYRFEVDYENDSEWSLGVVTGLPIGAPTTGPKIVEILRKMADLVEEVPSMKPIRVVYPKPEGAE